MSDIISKLRNHMADDHAFAEAFSAAFELALKYDIPQFAEYGIGTLDQYIDFYETMLTWIPSEDMSGKKVYYQLCLFYFVIDLPPVKQAQTPILPTSSAPWTWLSQWLIDYASVLGIFMNTTDSITPESIATFYTAPAYHMQDYPVPNDGWKTFNDFFARFIDPAVRPIYSPTDPTVIVSPADAVFDGAWPIDENADVTTFNVKHLPWSIAQLLEDSTYGKQFKNGIFIHAYLNTTDYHRQHAPVAGTVVEAKVIPGLCYLEVVTEADANGKLKLSMTRKLDMPDDPGYQFLQARGLVVLDNPDIGLVAVLPIGMAQVSSVMLSVKEGDVLDKGQEISYFQMGGSDIVVVFQARSKVDITAVVGTHYAFGTPIATAQRISA